MVRLLPFLSLYFLLYSYASWAQTTTATVLGTVKDSSGAVVIGAKVTLRNLETGFTRNVTTDPFGAYFIAYVPSGSYRLTVESPGFQTEVRDGLRFEVGQEVTIEFVLKLPELQESITVGGDVAPVEVTKNVLDWMVTREQIDDLPLNGRQASTLAALAPGVYPTGNPEEPVSAGGQPRGSGEILFDGVSGEDRGVNSFRADVPPDAIQEFQVMVSQFPAEFGQSSGLILNTVTRSGTNQLHGRGYYYHRDDALDARNAFALTRATFEQKQIGGWLGGPIIKDRAHFFVAYEGTRRNTIATVTSPAGPGDFPQAFDNDLLLVKLDYQLNSTNSFTGRFSLNRGFSNNQYVGGIVLEEVGIDGPSRNRSYVASWTRLISNRSLNELRFQFVDGGFQANVKNPDAYTVVRPSSISGKLPSYPQGADSKSTQLVENLSLERARHHFKLGFDLNYFSVNGFIYDYNPGAYVFATDQPFIPNDPATFPILYANIGDINFGITSKGYSGFAQDSWHVTPNLTLNLGLRYDGWSVTPGSDLNKLNFAPRLGFAWDPFKSGKTSIRGGFGIFTNNYLGNAAVIASYLDKRRSLLIFNPGYPDPYSGGVPTDLPVDVRTFQPDQPLPRSYIFTLGVQREIRGGWLVSADYVNSKGRNLIRTVDLNPIVPPDFVRVDPSRGYLWQMESTGFSNYHGLLVSLDKRIARRAHLGGSYTFSTYKTTNEAESMYQQDDRTPNDSYGYGGNDMRHRAVVNGTVDLKWGFQVSGILSANSAVPFDIVTGYDNNLNGIVNDRPDLAPGARLGTDDMRKTTGFLDPGQRPGNLPRNSGRELHWWQLDARFSKKFVFDRYRLELMVEAFNLDNHVNYIWTMGNLSSPLFGQPIAADPARQVQLAIRFQF